MKPEWINVALLAIGMIAACGLAIDHWVHRRLMGETNLASAVRNLKKQIDDGRGIWDRSVEIGYTVQALQTMVAEVKDILDRALDRDDGHRERVNGMDKQLARMEEHFKSIDREIVALRTELKELRGR